MYVGQGYRAGCLRMSLKSPEFWKGGALEDADTEAAGGPSRGQGIDLCGHSLRIEAGEKKEMKSGTFS